MKDLLDMSADEILAEQRRRDNRRANGLPLHETPAEAAERIVEDDARLEKEIQHDVVKLYRSRGCAIFNLSQARASKQSPGIADLYVFSPRAKTAWWHETKTPTGEQSAAQRAFQEYCEICDVDYVLGGLAPAEAQLQAIGVWA